MLPERSYCASWHSWSAPTRFGLGRVSCETYRLGIGYAAAGQRWMSFTTYTSCIGSR